MNEIESVVRCVIDEKSTTPPSHVDACCSIAMIDEKSKQYYPMHTLYLVSHALLETTPRSHVNRKPLLFGSSKNMMINWRSKNNTKY